MVAKPDKRWKLWTLWRKKLRLSDARSSLGASLESRKQRVATSKAFLQACRRIDCVVDAEQVSGLAAPVASRGGRPLRGVLRPGRRTS